MAPGKSTRKPGKYATRRQSAIEKNKIKCSCEVIITQDTIPINFFEDNSWLKNLTVTSSDEEQSSVRAFPIMLISISDVIFQLFQTSKQSIIVNIPSKFLEMIVNFSCTMQIDISSENILSLLAIAKEYNILYLMKLCGNFLMREFLPVNSFQALKIARQFLCEHMVSKILQFITRNFVDIMKQDCVKDIMVEDLSLICSSDELSIHENKLVNFIIFWAQENQASSNDVSSVLDNVRFTKLKQNEYFTQLSHPVIKIMLDNCPPPESMKTAKIFHDPPVSTRSQARKKLKGVIEEPHRIPREMVVTLGGWAANPPGPCKFSEAFDYLSDEWMVLDDLELPSNRAYHGLEIVGNKVYMVGGYDSTGPVYHNTLMALDLQTKTWHEKSQMSARRCYVASTLMDGKIYAVGGHDGVERHKTVEVYHIDRNQWYMGPDLIHPRSDLDCVSINGRIFAIGGFTGSHVMASIEVYDPAVGTWEIYAGLTVPRSGVKACVLGDKIYVLGGFDGTTRLKSVECFTPGSTRAVYHRVPDMINRRSNFSVSVMDNKIYVSGGYADPSVSSGCEVYDPVTNTWTEIPDMHHQKSALAQLTVSYHNVDNIASFLR